MDLKKLVSQTLQEIAEGAFEAKTLLPHKISVNPAPDKFDGNLSADGDGRIIAFLPSLGFSAKGERKDKITDAARVKFQVPYTLF